MCSRFTPAASRFDKKRVWSWRAWKLPSRSCCLGNIQSHTIILEYFGEVETGIVFLVQLQTEKNRNNENDSDQSLYECYIGKFRIFHIMVSLISLVIRIILKNTPFPAHFWAVKELLKNFLQSLYDKKNILNGTYKIYWI